MACLTIGLSFRFHLHEHFDCSLNTSSLHIYIKAKVKIKKNIISSVEYIPSCMKQAVNKYRILFHIICLEVCKRKLSFYIILATCASRIPGAHSALESVARLSFAPQRTFDKSATEQLCSLSCKYNTHDRGNHAQERQALRR